MTKYTQTCFSNIYAWGWELFISNINGLLALLRGMYRNLRLQSGTQ